MKKNVAPILPLSVIWNWTCNYLLILYNTDQKGNCKFVCLENKTEIEKRKVP